MADVSSDNPNPANQNDEPALPLHADSAIPPTVNPSDTPHVVPPGFPLREKSVPPPTPNQWESAYVGMSEFETLRSGIPAVEISGGPSRPSTVRETMENDPQWVEQREALLREKLGLPKTATELEIQSVWTNRIGAEEKDHYHLSQGASWTQLFEKQLTDQNHTPGGVPMSQTDREIAELLREHQKRLCRQDLKLPKDASEQIISEMSRITAGLFRMSPIVPPVIPPTVPPPIVVPPSGEHTGTTHAEHPVAAESPPPEQELLPEGAWRGMSYRRIAKEPNENNPTWVAEQESKLRSMLDLPSAASHTEVEATFSKHFDLKMRQHFGVSPDASDKEFGKAQLDAERNGTYTPIPNKTPKELEMTRLMNGHEKRIYRQELGLPKDASEAEIINAQNTKRANDQTSSPYHYPQ